LSIACARYVERDKLFDRLQSFVEDYLIDELATPGVEGNVCFFRVRNYLTLVARHNIFPLMFQTTGRNRFNGSRPFFLAARSVGFSFGLIPIGTPAEDRRGFLKR
jgi:hypothetical protein